MFLGEGSPFPPTTEIRALFSRPDGETLQEGDLFRNPEYAQDPAAHRSEGPRALYQGTIAAEIVTRHAPGAAARDADAARTSPATAPTWAEPMCRPYQGFTVCVPPPPSSGVSLLQMLEHARAHRHRQAHAE